MSEVTHDEQERQRKWAAEELTRMVCKLWLLSGKTQEQIGELMGYGRRVVAGMCNYHYGEDDLYPARRLSSFLKASGVYRPEDIARVFKAYDIVAGRTTTLEQIRVYYDTRRQEWIREDVPIEPETEKVHVDHSKRLAFERLIHSTS